MLNDHIALGRDAGQLVLIDIPDPHMSFTQIILAVLDDMHISEIGFGANIEPVRGLGIGLGDRLQWNPTTARSPTHLIGLDVFYTFDLSSGT